jgi:hypothetical protein
MNKYEILCNTKSDINEHLPTIKKYAIECDVVSEMGTRFVVSTWALVEANPKKITCYDINEEFFLQGKENIYEICQNKGIDFTFIKADTLKIKIDKTDLLLIDTLHRYQQLFQELTLHAQNVEKYIILHDTNTFGYVDEFIYDHASDLIQKSSDKSGLIPAIEDFLGSTDGSNWFILEKFENNNGLTILKRKNNDGF